MVGEAVIVSIILQKECLKSSLIFFVCPTLTEDPVRLHYPFHFKEDQITHLKKFLPQVHPSSSYSEVQGPVREGVTVRT